jgi:hypothetical protein
MIPPPSTTIASAGASDAASGAVRFSSAPATRSDTIRQPPPQRRASASAQSARGRRGTLGQSAAASNARPASERGNASHVANFVKKRRVAEACTRCSRRHPPVGAAIVKVPSGALPERIGVA